jgi:CubicO group peptidase (beta-lactamase class C family)
VQEKEKEKHRMSLETNSREKFLLIAVLLIGFSTSAPAGQSQASRAAEGSFSVERLARIGKVFQSEVDKGAIPGAVLVVARNGKVQYSKAVGYQDREKKLPMKNDAIFRIASMSKPITSVAVMMLAEEGKIDLLAPVAQYLPEFKDLKVGVVKTESGTAELALEPAERQITVQDLLRHTSGLVYGPFGNTPVHQAYLKANLFDSGQTLAEFVSKLSRLPLAREPGTAWEYGMSTDVLGRVVEVVSGMGFDQFVEQRISKPLGMRDTGFYLSSGQAGRLAEPQTDPATGKRMPINEADALAKDKVKWFSGGGGMLSTAGDYSRFCQMLLNGGELGGVRLLSRKTVAAMTADQLPPAFPRVGGYEDMAPTPEMGQGFGLGFAVRTEAGRNPLSGSPGDYFWAGAFGTYFWVDPKENLYAVMMTQMPFPQSGYYRRALRELVYGALLK